MGCGYSKLTGSKKRGRLKVHKEAADDDDDNDDVTVDVNVCCTDTSNVHNTKLGSEKYRRLDEESSTSSPETQRSKNSLNAVSDEIGARRRIVNKIRPISGPLKPPINRSASQLSFFRMLDEKIASGKDMEDDESSPSPTYETRILSDSIVRRTSNGSSSIRNLTNGQVKS